MLVGISACAFVLLGEIFIVRHSQSGAENVHFDPQRTIEATVAGVSFLGAGTIIVRGKQHVHGLTTAASLLACAAVGMLTAVERYVLAIATTVLLLLVVTGVQWLEDRLLPEQGKDKPPEDKQLEDQPPEQ
jgi:putative Mg2+ transporter-C (MgtC) family protein